MPERSPVNRFVGMNAWLALPLTLLLGQTPATDTPADSPDTQDPALVRQPSEEEVRAAQELELQELRLEVATLRAQLLAQQEEEQSRLQSLEQQQETQQARATELEQLRQERVASLARAYEWLISADQQLESGEQSIGPALVSARQELSTALSIADETGRGQTVRLIQSALARLSTVDEDVAQRNLYVARRQLQAAGFELHEAWRLSINRQDTTLVNQ
ncbi:hypothetical protein JRI60_15850 [Archangium violaceum]|uniref:hypothetical protein n=1 Tax=Archangium violaceum TaxID=83451 RepID=UPI0019529F15|nr:hypothetical protein [Archangium violaceum]QRO00394.1 hypothetical protein JRI60_15850 [Archangium violaceum]